MEEEERIVIFVVATAIEVNKNEINSKYKEYKSSNKFKEETINDNLNNNSKDI